MRTRFSDLARVGSAALLLIAAVSSNAHAQTKETDGIAHQAADAIARMQPKVKKAAVLDFTAPDMNIYVGPAVAGEFRDELAGWSHDFKVVERADLDKQQQRAHIPTQLDKERMAKLLKDMNVDAWVEGTVSKTQDGFVVTAEVHRVSTREKSAGFETKVSFDDDLDILTIPRADFDAVPLAGKDGYSPPECLHCPYAPYPTTATEYKAQGKVVLQAITEKDGTVRALRVLSALPQGLTVAAAKAVQGWKFKPSAGPDGKPAETRQTVEVLFRMY